MGAGGAAVAFTRARLNFDRMIYDTARRQAMRLPAQRLTGQLRAMAGSRRKAPGISHLEPLIDVLVHGQDIAIPLGLERSMPTGAAMTAASRVWPDLYPFRAARRLRGLRFAATDCDWAAGEAGEGPVVTGPIDAILLAPSSASQTRGSGRCDGTGRQSRSVDATVHLAKILTARGMAICHPDDTPDRSLSTPTRAAAEGRRRVEP